MAEISFQPDVQIVQIAEAYALDAVDVAEQNFGIKLDWSESSVGLIEEILDRMHRDMKNSNPSADKVWTFAKMLGSYVGEVLRRHHGGEWGNVSMNGDSFPGLRYSSGALCWPWGKIYNRLMNGSEDNVWHYYQELTRT